MRRRRVVPFKPNQSARRFQFPSTSIPDPERAFARVAPPVRHFALTLRRIVPARSPVRANSSSQPCLAKPCLFIYPIVPYVPSRSRKATDLH